MPKDARIDAYIEKSAPFAQPILKRLRKAVHTGCPGVVETIKWGMPAFEHKGPLCGMASFKSHATFGFWKAALLSRGGRPLAAPSKEAMGQFGRIESAKDLPSERVLIALVRQAAALNEAGAKVPRVRKPKPALSIPNDLRVALAKSATASRAFRGFPPSHKREYVEWITEAKRDETRRRRIETAVEWIAKGRARNWKYQK